MALTKEQADKVVEETRAGLREFARLNLPRR